MPRRVSNPPNPWESSWVDWLDEPPPAPFEVYEEEARSILARNESPDVPFRWSANPYRGCQHACAYCYARRTHQFLGFGAGTDFERKLVVKTNAPELLARALAARSWTGEPVTFSGVTDCYQPLEASYGLTRRCLEAALARRNPVAVVTKAALVRRDAELLGALARRADARVFVSVASADDDLARHLEPGTSAPSKRFEAMAALAAAGVPVGVAVAPLIPGLNEAEVPAVLRRARAAGATSAFLTLLRLPAEVGAVFRERLAEAFPERSARVLSALDDVRAGRPGESRFGRRMRGTGERWRAIERLFTLECRRLNLETRPEPASWSVPTPSPTQGELFGP